MQMNTIMEIYNLELLRDLSHARDESQSVSYGRKKIKTTQILEDKKKNNRAAAKLQTGSRPVVCLDYKHVAITN
jgi:hypothetical protein